LPVVSLIGQISMIKLLSHGSLTLSKFRASRDRC
jgi:hypothetical protein